MFGWFEKLINWLRQLFWKQELEVTLVGLQGAGKTTFVNVLSGGQFKEDQIPTVGFNMRTVQKGRVSLKVWDIGGQPRFRNMWERYRKFEILSFRNGNLELRFKISIFFHCRHVNAIVFMVDSADVEKVEDAKDELHKLFASQSHQGASLQGIPLLVLGNKNDLSSCMSQSELNERLRLFS